MVEVRDVYKRYASLTALDGVSVTIQPGTITYVVGPNGAGKSTLLKCLVGLVHPDSGQVLIHGKVVNHGWKYRTQIGYSPQTPRFPETVTTSELLNFVTKLRRQSAPEKEYLIELFKLQDSLARPLRFLSGGTRQKINLVLAMMFDVEILVMDEPTAGLDPLASRNLKGLLVAEKMRGKTIIVASHLLAELEELADHVVFLLDGRVYFKGITKVALAQTGEGRLENAIAKMMEGKVNCVAASQY